MKWIKSLYLSVMFGFLHISAVSPLTVNKLLSKTRPRRSSSSTDAEAVDSLYTRTSAQLSNTLYSTLFGKVLNGSQPVDIALLLDSSAYMGETAFNTGRHFLARIVSILPKRMFLNGTIRTGMITYSTMARTVKEFDFSYSRGHYKEMIRRIVRSAQYQGGIENHACQSIAWSYSMLANSSRFSSPTTKQVIVYATNGRVTDQDAYFGSTINSWTHAASWLKKEGVTVIMLPIGNTSDLTKDNLSIMASTPASDFVIPVENNSQVDSLIVDIKSRRRSSNNNNHNHS